MGSQNKGIEDNAEELFHIPITKRQLISNERFSLSGFPTLYLATELPLAWQECGYPDKYYWSEFRYSNLKEIAGDNNTKSGKICLLALYSPREITRWGRTIKYYEPELWLTVIRRYLAIYPLVLACSFVNANGGTPFKQEYIIPQMLMQWVYRHKRKCNGISYFSCIDDSAMPSKWNAYREKHILYSYQQLKDDDSTIQWLQNIADIEKCSIAMFWNTAGATQKVDLDWAKQNIESIKAPILARSNYISIFSPDNIKEMEFLGFGEDIERIIEKL